MYPNGTAVRYENSTIRFAAAQLIAMNMPGNEAPLYLQREGSENKIYYLESALKRYIKGESSYQDTMVALLCNGLYRNKADITVNGHEIDAGSLWFRHNNKLVLCSADEYASLHLTGNEDKFTEL
jgi:hypothetical protein